MTYRRPASGEFAPIMETTPVTDTAPTDADIRAYAFAMRRYSDIPSRSELEQLALMCGLPRAVVLKANNTDLTSVYTVALKDAKAARQVAQRIAMRLDDSLFGKPGTPTSPAPMMDNETLKAMMRDAVHEGALQPLQAALDTMDKELRTDMRESQRATLDAALETMRAGMMDAATEALRTLTPTRIDIAIADAPPVPLGLVHKSTARVIRLLTAGLNVYLHGPAGSGKTTMAQKCADAFMLKFYFAAKVESEYQLLGFKDAKGETVRTQFRDAYEHGGLFLFDELDGSSPSAVVALNAALANGICAFPDGTIARHKDFKVIAAGNTALTGATRQYAGRNQLDAASIDRFAFIEFGYDDELERALSTNSAWCAYVQSVRRIVKERGLNHLVTPRATYDGAKALAAGDTWDEAANACVFKGLDADTVAQIKAALAPKKEDMIAKADRSPVGDWGTPDEKLPGDMPIGRPNPRVAPRKYTRY